MSSAPIVCRYANRPGRAGACGAFDTEHHARAAALSVCCVELAFHDVDDQEVTPAAADWPPFAPTDDDIPAVDS